MIIPAYNEEQHLERCLDHVLAQEYPRGAIRVCIVDAGSHDETAEVARRYAAREDRVTVMTGRGRLSAGQAMNIGLEWVRAPFFGRVDAHTYLEPAYLRRGVENLLGDARIAVSSGQPEQIGETRFAQALAIARGSRFGVGGSVYAQRSERSFVDTVQGGVFRAEAVGAVGGFHPDPTMSEDDELNWRLRKAGYLVLLDQGMGFRYTARPTWRGAYHQYRGYGGMRARATREHPEMLRPYHVAPPAALVTALLSAVASPLSHRARHLLALGSAAYLSSALAAAVSAARPTHRGLSGHVAWSFTALHLGYAVGLLAGLVRHRPRVLAARRATGATTVRLLAEAPESQEVERLRRVYAEYDRTARGTTVWSAENSGNRMIVRERRRVTAELLRGFGLEPSPSAAILEIGCGVGDFLDDLLTLGFNGSNLHAVDLLESKVKAALRRHPGIDIRRANAEQLPFGDQTFDLVVLATVISSIFDRRMTQRVAAESARVLRPGGALLWYDMRYDNPTNRNVHGVSRRELRRLFRNFELDLEPVTVLPLLVRRLGRWNAVLYPPLALIRPLRTHLIGLLRKPSG